MPGLSIVYDLEGNGDGSNRRVPEALESLKHYPWYEESILLHDEHLFLGYTGYERYPIKVIEKDGYYICLEGVIYGRSSTESTTELENLTSILFNGADRRPSRVSEWLSRMDGEFLIAVLDKRSGEMCVINDALGRLPVYYHEANGRIILSREARYITNLTGEVGFDAGAISHYLLLGYPLGKKTLFEKIFRLGPASLLRIGPNNHGMSLETMLHFNVEEHEKEERSPEYHAGTLTEALCRSCSDRADLSGKILMALSGGLDSRTIAACLKKRDIQFTGITFLDSLGTASPDIPIAEEVAKVLGCEWRMFRLEPPRGRDVLRLLRLKSGMNYLGMSFCLPLCLELRDIYGPEAVLFTGDGGDKLIPDIRPPVDLDNIDSLASYIIDNFGVLPLDLVSRLTGIGSREIIDGLKDRLESYDEDNMKAKCMHFLIFERNFKWLFEGEDRNRCHLWVTSPFYSLDCFTTALRCPGEYKERYRLYRDVLRELSPELTSIDYAKWKKPIDSKSIAFYCYLRKRYLSLPTYLRKLIKKMYKKNAGSYRTGSLIMDCMRRQLDQCSAISDYLSTEDIRRNLHRLPKTGIENLFTVTSAIEDLQGMGSSIEEYNDSFLMG